MKKIFITLFLLLSLLACKAQDSVTNWRFEGMWVPELKENKTIITIVYDWDSYVIKNIHNVNFNTHTQHVEKITYQFLDEAKTTYIDNKENVVVKCELELISENIMKTTILGRVIFYKKQKN